MKFFTKKESESTVKWSLYGRVWNEVGLKYWKLLLSGVLFTILAAASEAYSIKLVKDIIDQGFIEKNRDSLLLFGLLIILAYFSKSTFGYLKILVMTKAALRGNSDLRRRIYNKMIEQPISYFHNTPAGSIIIYFTNMANSVLNLVTESVITIVQNVATIVMMLCLMFMYAPQMTAVLVILIPGIVLPIIYINRKRNIVMRRGFGAEASSMTHITQSIEGIKTIQAYSAQKKESAEMSYIEDQRIALSFKIAKLSGLQSPILEIIISLGLCAAILIGGHFIVNGDLTTGDFTAFLLALTAAYKPAKSLTELNGQIQMGLIAAEALFNFLDKEVEIKDKPDAITLEKSQMEISLSNVNFAYNSQDGNVLKDISINVKPGEICAFVGQSGGGKSTIFNLLTRFYEPQQGSITFNGKNINDLTLKSLRDNIAIVSQDVFLFNGTIEDNIRYGNQDATKEQIIEAAKSANAHEFIMSFPNQYQSHVGERGAMLSGGQKQRIAIARAILKDAPVLLLDEATSALDTQSERLIQNALKKLMQNRTTFVIAHRLTTILDADMIYVIKEGQVVEHGSDAELTALNGEYKKLKDAQFNNQH